MLAVHSGRRGGKTYELVRWFKEDEEGRQIVVHTVQFAKHLREMYDIKEKSMIHPQKVVSYQQVMQGCNRGMPQRQMGIDNVEFLLGDILGQAVDIMTFTGAAMNPVTLRSLRDSSSR